MFVSGSSPRVRGTHLDDCAGARGVRFIPACAGNASPIRWIWISPAVHPRVCGERSLGAQHIEIPRGSSPRVRGTQSRVRAVPRLQRFIPACAGNAPDAGRQAPAAAVHPRVCGERPSDAVRPPCHVGSSPRVRGTPCRRCRAVLMRRFIPACAGNAALRRRWALR